MPISLTKLMQLIMSKNSHKLSLDGIDAKFNDMHTIIRGKTLAQNNINFHLDSLTYKEWD